LRRYSQALWQHRFVRFLIVGVLNSLFGYGIFALCVFAGMHYGLALLVATILGVLFNFKTIGKFVFGSHDNRLIVRFAATYAAVYGLNVEGVRLLKAAGLGTYVAGAMMIIPMAAVAFLFNKWFVFNNAKTH
jgi:putative flippase GtrA